MICNMVWVWVFGVVMVIWFIRWGVVYRLGVCGLIVIMFIWYMWCLVVINN